MHPSELSAMNYDKAMKSNDEKLWEWEANNEHNKMTKNKVWKVVKKHMASKGAKINMSLGNKKEKQWKTAMVGKFKIHT